MLHSLQHAKYFGSRVFVTRFAGSARAAPPDPHPAGRGWTGSTQHHLLPSQSNTTTVLTDSDREHGANRQVGATRKAGSRAGTCWEVQDGFTWSVTKSSANNALAPFLLQNKDVEDICKISFNPYFQSFKKKHIQLSVFCIDIGSFALNYMFKRYSRV